MYGNASLVIHWNEGLEGLTIETTKIIELNYHSIPQAPTKEVYKLRKIRNSKEIDNNNINNDNKIMIIR